MENYEYIGDLGSGSYGFVWKCLQRSSGRIVAVKGFKLAHTDKKFLDQAIREVRMLRASCDHPNVVQLLEAFRSSSGRVYMVFEFVDRCLSSELHKRFTCGLPAAQTRLVLWQLLCAVAHLHSKKIIHRDIKPGNLLMTSDGVLKLCDFGFARTTRGEPYQPDRFSSYVVTRWYRSPEMLVSDLYSAASDVWSLGCTFAEIATGRPLFPGTSSLDQLWRIMRCLGSLPPSQAERFAAAATAAGLPEPPPPPPRGKSLWQRLPELEGGLLDVVQACLRLDPAQRPTAAQLLQMPYFTEVPKLLAGSPLEKLYGEYGAALSQRPRTTSGRNWSTAQQQQQQSAEAARGVAVTVMSSEELVREAKGDKGRVAANGGRSGDGRGGRRPNSVSLSAVAASLLGEVSAPPGGSGSGSVQLVPLLVPQPPPPLPSLDFAGAAAMEAAAAVASTAAALPPLPCSSGAQTSLPSAPLASSSKRSLAVSVGVNVAGSTGQPSSPSPSPQPPSRARMRSGTSPRSLPPLTQHLSSRRQLDSLATVPAPAAAGAATEAGASPQITLQQVVSDLGLLEQPEPAESTMDGPVGRPGTAKRLAASQDAPMASGASNGDAVAAAASAALTTGEGRFTPKAELVSPQVRAGGAGAEMLLAAGSTGDPGVGYDGGLGLMPHVGDELLSDGEGHISEDDELMEYFAAKSVGSGLASAAAAADGGGGVRADGSGRAMTVPSNVTGATLTSSNPAAVTGTGGGSAAATAGGGTASSASMPGLPAERLNASVQDVYASCQTHSSGVASMNRRMAAMVMNATRMTSGSGGASAAATAAATAPEATTEASQPAKRATVGSYVSVPPSSAAAPGEPAAAAATPAAVAPAAAARPRTAGVGGAAMTEIGLYRSTIGGAGSSSSHGVLPALQSHHNPHAMTTTTGTGLASSSSLPYSTAIYGRASMPMAGFAATGSQCNGVSANVADSARRRALSRQGSVVFNQLMYDALPEIGTPGGAPEVPAGTPPRRRVVMSGFTPCRTAAARAAAEGVPPAAAMAAVMGEALHSTMTDFSVACSPIQGGRSVDLLSPERGSGRSCDTAATVRRPHRRQASLASLPEPPSGLAAGASPGNGGGRDVGAATAGPVVASAAGYHSYRFAADQAAVTAVNGGDALGPMVLGSSAPTLYHTRPHTRPPDAGAAAISSGVSNGAAAGGVAGRIPITVGGGGGGGAASASSGLSLGSATATQPSGARGLPHTPPTPAARSRLASGQMMRDGYGGLLTTREADVETTQSTDLDPLGTWGGAGFSPARGAGGGAGMAPPQPLQQAAAAAVACGGTPVHPGLPPAVRGRLGRWASGLIDSLPEDREVLHMAYGDWHGSYNDGSVEAGGGGVDDAIQMLAPVGSADWATAGGGATGGLRNAVANTLPRVTSPRPGSSGPLPPASDVRAQPGGSGTDRRAVTSTAVGGPPPIALKSFPGSFPRDSSPTVLSGGSPRMPSGRSRRNLQMAAAAAAAAAVAGAAPAADIAPAAAAADMNRASSTDVQSLTSHPDSKAADTAVGRERPRSSGGGAGGGTGTSSGSGKGGGSKLTRAKAIFKGGISSLVRKFK